MNGTGTDCGPPLLPVATVVLLLGQVDVTADVPMGFVVLQDMLTVQVLAPAAIVQEDGESVRAPVISGFASRTVPKLCAAAY
jgi:hypothetical protein